MRDEFATIYDDQIAKYFGHEALGHFFFFKDESLLVVFHKGDSLELLTTTKDDAVSDLVECGIQSGRLAELTLGLKQALESIE